MKNTSQPANVNLALSAKQATALRKIARAPIPIEKGKQLLQTTLGSLYRRQLIYIQGGFFRISGTGEGLLYEHSHADIARSASACNSPFAAIIKELASYTDTRKTPARLHVITRSARVA